MRIIFVRHGHPDYRKNCLTELGRRHATAAAERLAHEPIAAVYSSPFGRAFETAEYIAKPHGKDVNTLDCMREIRWDANADPWLLAREMVTRGESLLSHDWAEIPPYAGNLLLDSASEIAQGIDTWLLSLGYEREGNFYRVRRKNDDTVLLVSHAGSSSAALSHILNLPLPFVCRTMEPDFTAVTVVAFYGASDDLISPKFEIMNDARHLKGIEAERMIEQ